MDTFPVLEDDPRTLHRYGYSHADPVNFTDPTGRFEGLAGALTVVAIAFTIASIACTPLRRPRTVSVSWNINLPPTGATSIRESAMLTVKRGIEQLGVPVIQGAQGYYRLQMVEKPTRGGIPAGALGRAFSEERRAEIYYSRTANFVRRLGNLAADFDQALGNSLGFVGVHEFGHLVIPDHSEYHDLFDPNAYNSSGIDSPAAAATSANMTAGIGYWPSTIKDKLRKNLGTAP